MWYPEEPLTYCPNCDLDIPLDCYWRGRGFIISGPAEQKRATVLYSQCPECGQRLSVALEGPWWHRLLYGWLWRLRYPNTRPPKPLYRPARQPRRRASGE